MFIMEPGPKYYLLIFATFRPVDFPNKYGAYCILFKHCITYRVSSLKYSPSFQYVFLIGIAIYPFYRYSLNMYNMSFC